MVEKGQAQGDLRPFLEPVPDPRSRPGPLVLAGVSGARSVDAQADAKFWLSTAATDSRRGELFDPCDGDITLTEYIEEHW
jgi:hypothetical protein